MPLRILAAAALLVFVGRLAAHNVPTIVVEAEFTQKREAAIHVKLDPRLFLSSRPTDFPPVPASWWTGMKEGEQNEARAKADDYLRRVLTFRVGEAKISGPWKFLAVDSALNVPINTNSAEVDLMAEFQGPLPDVAGDFKIEVAPDCAVGIILLNSIEGKADRHPQSLFPGESSRGFKLPPPASQAAAAPVVSAAPPPAAPDEKPAEVPGFLSRWFQTAHFSADHLIVAIVLAFGFLGKAARAVFALIAFHVVGVLATSGLTSGWLPDAPMWMRAVGWLVLLCGLASPWLRGFPAGGVIWSFAVAGFCHGLDRPHLHLAADATNSAWLRDSALLLVQQIILFALASVIVRAGTARPLPESAV